MQSRRFSTLPVIGIVAIVCFIAGKLGLALVTTAISKEVCGQAFPSTSSNQSSSKNSKPRSSAQSEAEAPSFQPECASIG
jgi:hypothetical protein